MKLALTGTFVILALACQLKLAWSYPGEPDETFGNHGLLHITSDSGASLDVGRDVLAQGDGKILVLGMRKGCSALLRRNSDGTPDEAFNSGKTPGETPLCPLGAGSVNAMDLQADGKIVVLGSIGEKLTVLRLLASGELDTSFNANGSLPGSSSVSTSATFGFSIMVQPDGKVLALGTRGGPEQIGILARWKTDGRLDSTLGGGGEILIDYHPNIEQNGFRGLGLQSNGTMVAGNTRGDYSTGLTGLVYGFTANGGLNSLFDGGGIAQPTDEEEITITNLALQADDKILITGKLTDGGADYAYIGRLTSFGFPDTGVYGGGWGRSTIPLDPHHAGVDLAVQDDGKALLLGKIHNQSFLVARFTEEGYPDMSFGDQGVQILEAGYDFSASAIDLQTDGKLLAVGTVNKDIVLARFHGDPVAAPVENPGPLPDVEAGDDSEAGKPAAEAPASPAAVGCSLRKDLP